MQEKVQKEQIAFLFNKISHVYDWLNHALSFGIDVWWRKRAVESLRSAAPGTILDVATGTGDFAIAALALNPTSVVGVDIAQGMLEHGRLKIARRRLDDRVKLMTGDAENLPFPENNFDAVIVAFGVRNFEHVDRGLSEMLRVTRRGGRVVILEFSKPSFPVIKQLYRFYFTVILPRIGRLVSRHHQAYSYLPASVQAFPEREEFLSILRRIGYRDVSCTSLTLGICSLYCGTK